MDQFSVLVYLNSILHSNKKTMDYNLPHLHVVGCHCLLISAPLMYRESIVNMEYAKNMGYQVFSTDYCNVLSGDKLHRRL